MGGDLRAAGERIEQLLGELGRLPDPAARQRAEELVRLLMELYGGGLERIVQLVQGADRAGPAGGDVPAGPAIGVNAAGLAGTGGGLLDRLAADDLVGSLLILHGLHPLDTAERIEQALASVRPFLATHGGGVELLEVDRAGRVRLRLNGSCNGCPSSRVTMQSAVERAIAERAPEVVAIEVEGLDPEAASAPSASPDGTPAPARIAPGPCLTGGGETGLPRAAGGPDGGLVQLGSGAG